MEPQTLDAATPEAKGGSPVVRWVSIVVIAVGVVLLGVGVAAFVSASDTSSDSQATKDQVESLRAEAASLDQERDDALADADAAVADADTMDEHREAVIDAALEVQRIDADASDAWNELNDCGDIVNEAAFVDCAKTGLESFTTATAGQADSVADLRAAIADLEEDLR